MLTEYKKEVTNAGIHPSRFGLEQHGIRNIGTAYWNLTAAQLLEHALQRREGNLAANGSLVVRTGQFTGRSPKDKFVVRDEVSEAAVHWGPVNQPMTGQQFDGLYARMLDFWQGQDLYVQDCLVGADPEYALRLRVVTQFAWHNLFARQLFIAANPLGLDDHQPEFTIFFAPDLHADPAVDGTNSATCIAVSFKRRIVLICGTM